MNVLAEAVNLAATIHLRQVDSAGAPYILHPLRVMHRVGTTDELLAATAVLHDAFEDQPWARPEVERLMPREVVCSLDLLFHDPAMEYPEYISRLLLDERARRVKREDLKDNMDSTRFKHGIPDRWLQKLPRYALALQAIENYRP